MTPIIEPIAFVSLLTRLIVGFLFFIQGYDKIFKVGKNEVIAAIEPSFQKIGLPTIFTKVFLFLTSWIEFIAGGFLILGLFKYLSIYLLGIDLLFVVIGMSLITPVLDLKHIFPRLVLLLLLLLLPAEADILSLDFLLLNK
jgi:putative oxidoreductase